MIASGTLKLDWRELPSPIRAEIERLLGAPVVEAITQPGGFSPGVAAKVKTSSGRTAFVKSSSMTESPWAASANRREIKHTKILQGNPRVPKLLHAFEQDEWVTLIYEVVAGRHPELPWKLGELDLVIREIEAMSRSVSPCPEPESFGVLSESSKEEFNGWINFQSSGRVGELGDEWITEHLDSLVALEHHWPEAAEGDSLVHTDIRADQILLTSSGAVFLDWPHALRGAPWIDFLCMFPSVELQGGPRFGDLVQRSPLVRVPREKLLPMAVALAGFFMWNSVQPPPPRLVTIRKFQRDQGDIVMNWIKAQGI